MDGISVSDWDATRRSKNLKKNMNLILYNSKTIFLLDESTAVQFWMVVS